VEERRDLLRTAAAAAAGRVPVVMGVGTNDTRTTVALAEEAARHGASAILVVTPYYNKPTADGLLRHFETVMDAVDLPILAYNVPSRTACDLMPATVARLAERPRFAGIKDATGNLARAIELSAILGSDRALLSGDDATFLPFLACGGHGVISVVSNVAPREMVALQAAWDGGDAASAHALAVRLHSLSQALFMETSPGPVKVGLAAQGRIRPGVRSPLVWPGPAVEQRIRRELEQLGPAR
jgi:4-hydroxy-tetrahydrodipicolinate synthase